MGYVIAGILVLLVVAGFVTFLVVNATKRGGPNPAGGGPPGVGPDETPLGDTSEHAGRQSARGETAEDPERERGTARPTGGTAAPGEGGVGGEAEGGRAVTPESERLANRPR